VIVVFGGDTGAFVVVVLVLLLSLVVNSSVDSVK